MLSTTATAISIHETDYREEFRQRLAWKIKEVEGYCNARNINRATTAYGELCDLIEDVSSDLYPQVVGEYNRAVAYALKLTETAENLRWEKQQQAERTNALTWAYREMDKKLAALKTAKSNGDQASAEAIFMSLAEVIGSWAGDNDFDTLLQLRTEQAIEWLNATEDDVHYCRKCGGVIAPVNHGQPDNETGCGYDDWRRECQRCGREIAENGIEIEVNDFAEF